MATFERVPLESPEQTAATMARFAVGYRHDIGEKAKWPLKKFHDYVKRLPYIADPDNHETVSRPAFLMRSDWHARDCDDKSVLMGAWFACNGVPFRFVASSRRPDKRLHHVFPVARLGGRWVPTDATYPRDKIGLWPKNATKIQPITGEIMATLDTYQGDELGFSLTKAARAVGRVTKRAAKTTGRVAVRSAKTAARVVSRISSALMPDFIERQIKSAVRSVVGNRTVTPAIKATILPAATAAALAIPGVQPYAAAVPVVVNKALDEIIKQGKSAFVSPGSNAPKSTGIAKAVTKAAALAKAKKLKAGISAMKDKATAAPAAVEQETERPAWLIPAVGGTAAILGLWYLKSRSKARA